MIASRKWTTEILQDVCEFTRKPAGVSYSDYPEIPFVPMENVLVGRTYVEDFNLKSSTYAGSGNYFEAGDILFAKITPCFENGKQSIVRNLPGKFGIASTELIPIRGKKNKSSTLFIHYFLLESELRRRIAQKMEGATGRQRVPISILKNWPISLPPLPEQEKIAAVLLNLQNAISIQEKIIESLRDLKKSTMNFVFSRGLRGKKTKSTPIGEIPESWEVFKLQDCFCITKKPADISYKNYKSIAFLPMDMIPQEKPFINKYQAKGYESVSSGTYFENGDMLLSKITPCFENGKQGIALDVPNYFGIASTEIIPIKGKKGIGNIYFLFYYLLLPSLRRQIANKMEGATGRQRIPVHLIKDWPIPLPQKIEEQNEIADAFLKIDNKIEIHTSKKSVLLDLFKTILNKLMTGETRVE